jgi:hypothetical protein
METMTNESLITRARNTLTAKFLINPDSTHLMFIDADIGWEPWHLLVMLNADKDVIGGLYPMKSLPIKWCVNGFDGAKEDGALQEVSKTGTGFLLIKRHVFEKLNKHPHVIPFKNDIGLPVELDAHMKTYFDTGVRENRYYSEDWAFCENWRDLGGEVWVDKRVLLKHSGTYVFSNENQEQAYRDLHAQAMNNQQPAQTTQIVPTVTPTVTPPVVAAEPPAPVAGKVMASKKKKK